MYLLLTLTCQIATGFNQILINKQTNHRQELNMKNIILKKLKIESRKQFETAVYEGKSYRILNEEVFLYFSSDN